MVTPILTAFIATTARARFTAAGPSKTGGFADPAPRPPGPAKALPSRVAMARPPPPTPSAPPKSGATTGAAKAAWAMVVQAMATTGTAMSDATLKGAALKARADLRGIPKAAMTGEAAMAATSSWRWRKPPFRRSTPSKRSRAASLSAAPKESGARRRPSFPSTPAADGSSDGLHPRGTTT